MKRAAPLARRTALAAKTPLKRTAALRSLRDARSVVHPGSAGWPKRRTASPIQPKVRKALAERSGGMCEVTAPGCMGRATDASHRIAVKLGGRRGPAAARHHVLPNLLHACRGCHSELHAAPAAAYWRGWMLQEHEIPSSVPVLYRGTWRLLNDDGSTVPTNRLPEEA